MQLTAQKLSIAATFDEVNEGDWLTLHTLILYTMIPWLLLHYIATVISYAYRLYNSY